MPTLWVRGRCLSDPRVVCTHFAPSRLPGSKPPGPILLLQRAESLLVLFELRRNARHEFLRVVGGFFQFEPVGREDIFEEENAVGRIVGVANVDLENVLGFVFQSSQVFWIAGVSQARRRMAPAKR